ncbi:Ig-like domain-containing protein [Pseudomonas sp. Pseusp97]|uniref:Ig-like domain-containing protein n=1 Tax=Pseudomonas sp. Pseusp97 TaxID=3243065 RepID=UPI0039A6B2B6
MTTARRSAKPTSARKASGNTSVKSNDYIITTDYSGPNSDSTTLTINTVAGDDIVNKAEAAGNVKISGTVTGEFTKGDLVTFKLDGTTYSAAVCP